MKNNRLSYKKAAEVLTFQDSYSRMNVMLHMFGEFKNSSVWYRLVGDFWSICDLISLYREPLQAFLPKQGPVVEMMTKKELAAYEALPEVVTIYRGCGKKNRRGPSWSLDKDVASKFPFLNRYQVAEPMLLTAKVHKSQILAVKLCRQEAEVITFHAKPGKGIPLSPPEGFCAEITSDDGCAVDTKIGIAADAPVEFEIVSCETTSATEMVTL